MHVARSFSLAFVPMLAILATAPLPGEEPSPEPYKLRVAYSPNLRGVPSWSAELDCAVSRAGLILEEALGRDLTIDSKVPWFGGSVGRSARELREALLEEVEREGADLVLGLGARARRPPPGPRPEGVLTEPSLDFTRDEGLANYTEGYLGLEVLAEDLCDISRLLAHEIAHIFGAVHRQGRRLLMDPGGSFGLDVDPLNEELLRLHRDRGFGRGKAPLSGEDLRTLWRLARADVKEAQTWTIVGALAVRMGKPAAAIRNYERALAIDPGYREALVYLGHARFQLGELRAAEASYLKVLEGGDDALVLNNLAAVYYGLGEPRRSLPYLEKALALGYSVDPRFIAAIEEATGKRIRR